MIYINPKEPEAFINTSIRNYFPFNHRNCLNCCYFQMLFSTLTWQEVDVELNELSSTILCFIQFIYALASIEEGTTNIKGSKLLLLSYRVSYFSSIYR